MSEGETAARVFRLALYVMGGFGIVVLSASLVAWARQRSARSLLVKYLAWFLIVPPILIPLLYSTLAFQFVICLISLQCFKEFSWASGLWKDRGLVVLSYGLMLGIYLPVVLDAYSLHQAMPLFTLAVLLLMPLHRNEYAHMVQKVCLSLLGVLYFGWFLSHLAYLRNQEHGLATVFLVMVLVESNDACAYFWGKLLGRHKLIPKISPNKTIEGTIGAMLCVIGIGLLLRELLPLAQPLGIVLVAVLVSVLGILGDLTISFLKRDFGVKDMGTLIPGHGGLLDRVDSLIFTAPALFHVVRYCHG